MQRRQNNNNINNPRGGSTSPNTGRKKASRSSNTLTTTATTSIVDAAATASRRGVAVDSNVLNQQLSYGGSGVGGSTETITRRRSSGVLEEKGTGRLTKFIGSFSIVTLLIIGAIVRALLLLYSVYHDATFRVKYTDIDYMIIVDGAKEMVHGGSPFDRTTFRYTPLLGAMMIPSVLIAAPMGKIFFALSDLGAAYYSYTALISFATEASAKTVVTVFILLNPVVLNVSTRGNSDMIITFLSLAVLAKFSQHKNYQAAAILGFAVHFKIYPIIYALPLALAIWERSALNQYGQHVSLFKRMRGVLPVVFGCGVLALITFAIPTCLCYAVYGQRYLDEAFIYHVKREDHRHNFSPYWLLMYLNMSRRALGLGVEYAPGLLAFIPQAIVLFFVSYKLRRNVMHACCVETVLFVAFNKVCTVQYFVWFLPFLAFIFCEPIGDLRGATERPGMLKTIFILLLWCGTIPLWVMTAIPLEFHGHNDYVRLWIVSCVFFLATVSLATWLARVAYAMQISSSHLSGEKKVE